MGMKIVSSVVMQWAFPRHSSIFMCLQAFHQDKLTWQVLQCWCHHACYAGSHPLRVKKKKNPHHSNDTSYILGFSVPTTGGTPSLIEAPPWTIHLRSMTQAFRPPCSFFHFLLTFSVPILWDVNSPVLRAEEPAPISGTTSLWADGGMTKSFLRSVTHCQSSALSWLLLSLPLYQSITGLEESRTFTSGDYYYYRLDWKICWPLSLDGFFCRGFLRPPDP